jgi:GT2 family glycosyltransferase
MTKLGHLLYTYSNVDDARIQQEISKQLYAERFDGVQLVHTYTGKPEWGYEQYLEDELIVMENRGHFRGAADHLAAGLRYFMEHGDQDVRYVLVAAADSWILDAAYLQKIIKTMERDGQVLAVSSWFSAYPEDIQGFSTCSWWTYNGRAPRACSRSILTRFMHASLMCTRCKAPFRTWSAHSITIL